MKSEAKAWWDDLTDQDRQNNVISVLKDGNIKPGSDNITKIYDALKDYKCRICGRIHYDCIPSSFRDDCIQRSIMEDRHICFACATWTNLIEIYYLKGESIIINGSHYHDAGAVPPKTRGFLGFGGHRFKIKMTETGKMFETNNLWHQGEIPKHFRDVLKDNAEFVVDKPKKPKKKRTKDGK